MGEVSRLRWVPPALAVGLGLLALAAVLVDLLGPAVLHQAEPGGPAANWLITLAVTLPCTAVGVLLAARRPANPICIAIAVLKYRLYAIDRIISRIISYLIITAVLAGVFAGLVLFATSVLPVKAPVAVAAATLAAAALFNPLRRRVQHAVDRRFNRTRYNAEAVVASFTAQLRQTVNLDTMQGELSNTVQRAFEPAHVSIWSADGNSRS